MLLAENLAGIESEGRRLVQAARKDPERPVPQYPDWTLGDLVSHTASIVARTALIYHELPTERIPVPRLPEGKDVFDWYDEILDDLLTALREADPNSPCWGFGPEPNLGFWERRMAIEIGIHRWDAYQALGEEDRLTDLVARSGLEEFPDVWLPLPGEPQTLQITATDLGDKWVFGEGEPTAAVEGTASDLYLRLFCRSSPVELPQDWAESLDALSPPPKP